MRLIISTLGILTLAACQVTKDDANDSVSVTYNQDVAENAVADAGNVVENTATAIGNDVQREGDKLENKVGDHDADDAPAANANDDNQ
jgi:hypothetical protein